MNRTQLTKIIRKNILACGSQNALARKWGISNAYMSEVMCQTRAPGPSILRHLGLIRQKKVVVTYEPGVQPMSGRWPRKYLP